MNIGKYGKATWINLIKTFSKYEKLQDLQEKDNICEIAFDFFPFVHLIVNYITLSFIPTWYKLHKNTT